MLKELMTFVGEASAVEYREEPRDDFAYSNIADVKIRK